MEERVTRTFCGFAHARRAQGDENKAGDCERGDSNPHAFRHQILSLARLPIPPLSRPKTSACAAILPSAFSKNSLLSAPNVAQFRRRFTLLPLDD